MKFKTTCCEFSKSQLEYDCEQHGDSCPDRVLKYSLGLKDDGFNIPPRFLLLAENAAYEAKFCPSCGKKLKEYCKLAQ